MSNVTLRGPGGEVTSVPEAEVPTWTALKFRPESPDEHADRVGESARNANTSALGATATKFLGTATLGASTIAARAIGGADEALRANREAEAHPYGSFAGDVLGSVTPGGLVSRAGAAAKGALAVGKEAGLLAHVASAVGSGAIEGGVMGAGAGVSEFALSEDPLTVERAVSVIGHNFATGAGVGAVAGGIAKLTERGLVRAQEAIESHIAETSKLAAVPDDLAGLDAKGLTAAKESHLAELETTRVADRKAIADDLGAFRNEVKDSKIFLATKEADAKAIGNVSELAARNAKGESALRNVLDNPIALAEKPQMALTVLQKQQSALEGLVKADPELRAAFAADATGARAASLDAVAPTLEKNLALQERIRASMAPHASPKLDAIAAAQESLKAGGGKSAIQSMAEVGMQGPIMHAVGAAIPIPVVGHAVGAWVAKKATDLVFNRMSLATTEVAKKTANVVGRFVDVAGKATKVAPVLATKVLQSVRFAAPGHEDRRDEPVKTAKLDEAFHARSAEIRSQVMPGPDGRPVMRPDTRAAMAQKLLPIRTQQPIFADRMETMMAARIEYLANALPKKPDIMAMQAGPDRWKPSELAMRSWARKVAAAEDPAGVEDRLAAGTLTPEDAEAYNAVYPERAAHLKQQIQMKLPELRSSLPYSRRLALSLFSGVPVDPAMAPNVFAVLQSSFQSEDGKGTTSAPMAAPQFGSVKKSVPEPTPAQTRSG